MKPMVSLLMRMIQKLPLSDQFELINEIDKNIVKYNAIDSHQMEASSTEYTQWLERVIHINPEENQADILDKRIENERSAWD